ncbi:HEAT repeat domain-containing protein [Clavibacter sp. CFBP 8614]|uniref:HEAT repeat domain-containing protein n=1 Tax=unclassified Clavibacter TaxID=2626594 RepID=UPI004041C808
MSPSGSPDQPSRPTEPTTAPAALVAALADPDRDVRQEAALALGERADEATLGAVLERLWAEPDFFVRETLTWAVARVGAPAIPGVRQALGADRSSGVRTQALHVLSKIAHPSTVDDLVPLIDDADEAVAAKARWALARIGDARAVPLVAAHLGAADAEARNALTDVLAAFGSAAVPTLVVALGDARSVVRAQAAEALGRIGSPDADPAVAALGSAAEDADAEAAVSALMALGAIDGEDARAAIQRATSAEDPRIRAVAERLAARPPRRSRLEEARAARAARLAREG